MLSEPQTNDPIMVTVLDPEEQKSDDSAFVIRDHLNEYKERERLQISQIVD